MGKIDSDKILKMLSEIRRELDLAYMDFINNQVVVETAKKNMDEHLVNIKNILYWYSD